MRGLFLNCSPDQCSIYESGKMMFDALKLSTEYSIDYQEITARKRTLPGDYNFLVFNYHPFTMDWLDTSRLHDVTGLAIAFVLEILPNDPFPMISSKDFDAYCAIDPTMLHTDKRVYAFPRPLEQFSPRIVDEKVPDVPVIGSFGFATPGKGFEEIVEAVNEEFDEAIVRLNITFGTSTIRDNSNYAKKLADVCKNLAKPGVEVQISHDYMTKPELIEWCSQNTLNCFLYDRNIPGLSATTDQAITSGRPLAVSGNPTFRHIHKYVTPYPWRTLKQSIELSRLEVLQMQRDWHPKEFANRFAYVLKNMTHPLHGKEGSVITLEKKNPVNLLSTKVKNHVFPTVRANVPCAVFYEKTVLFVSQKERKCGIYQYGKNIYNSLKKSRKYKFIFCECGSKKDLDAAISRYNPKVVIYNYHPTNSPWLNKRITRSYPSKQLAIIHEFVQKHADEVTNEMFDYSLYQDPNLIERNPYVIKTLQLMYPYENTKPEPLIPTIGSFGFGFSDKGFERLVSMVQEEFDEAIINLHMPFNDVVDPRGANALQTAENCRRIIKKPGIILNVTHDFWTEKELLDFLAGNTINCFFTDVRKTLGISGAIHHALACRRPIAITKCQMYRDILDAKPSICIEDSSLKEIIANGTKPLEPFYKAFSEEAFIKDYERILDKVLK